MKQRDKYLLSIIGVVILLGGFWMLMLKPKRAELSDVTKEVEAKQAAVDELSVKTQAVGGDAGDVKINFAATYARMAKLGKAVPPAGSVDDDIPSLLLQTNQGANVTRTAFLDYTPGSGDNQAEAAAAPPPAAETPPAGGDAATTEGQAPAATAAAPTPSTFKASFRGSFFDLESLLNYMTNMVTVKGKRLKVSGRLVSVDSVDFTVTGFTKSGTPKMKAEIQFTTYTTQGNPLEAAPSAPPGTDPTQPQAVSDPAGGATTPPAAAPNP